MIVIYGTNLENDNISRNFFQFLKILICQDAGDRGRGDGKTMKNGPKWQKIICLILYLRNCTSYDCDFWYTFVKWYLQQFFYMISELWIFGFLGI